MTSTWRRRLTWTAVALFVATLLVVGRPVAFLAWVWWHDPPMPLSASAPGFNDASGLNPNQPGQVIPIAESPAEAERQLVALVTRAAAEHRQITISGAAHSMGGHTLYPGALVLNMLPFNGLALDNDRRILRAGAGAKWADVIPYLDTRGWSVSVMQSNNDFTVGGSLSVNCHGWQLGVPPIVSTVESFRLLQPDGRVVRVSRDENAELFGLVLGGYGMFGVILDAELRVTPNEFYAAESHVTRAADYARDYEVLTRGRADLGLAYGRISVAPESFLDDAVITVMARRTTSSPVANTLTPAPAGGIRRLVFRGSVGSDYGKSLRWQLERWLGEVGSNVVSRNQILNEPAALYANRDPASAEVLQEYFIPKARLGEFLQKARPVFLRHHSDLLNITVREVRADRETVLAYAREDMFGLVMLFHQGRDDASERAIEACEREVIEVASASGGSYYLPYRPHATVEQFARAYPQAHAFVVAKRRFDPREIFTSQFYARYGKPLIAESR